MKLFSKIQAHESIKLENDQLVESNIRLRKFHSEITSKLNNAKTSYDPEKIKALEDFDKFTKDIAEKKNKMFRELIAIQAEIDKQKDIYYGYIIKSDELIERNYLVEQKEKKLETRELFVEELERKFQEKAYG